jgi:colicin import membrane protein
MTAPTLDDLRPRPPKGLSRAATLALLAHVLLVIALTFSVNWRTSEPAGVEAELWAAVPQAAAPRAVEPEPTPPQPVKPEPPKPAPQPTPKVEPPPPDRDADIAREKREKEKLEQQRADEERKREAALKAALEKQQQQEEVRAEADRKKKAEAARVARLEAQRQENLKRILGQADATGAPDSTGAAAQSAGPSASYAGRIKARIKPNIVFADEVSGNPLASVEVKVAPDGTIVGRRLVKSSGVGAWDDAVLRAIDRTETLPRDTDGRVPPAMVIDFRPRDF